MSRNLFLTVVAIGFGLVACSDKSPVEPSHSPLGPPTYQLTFFGQGGGQPVSSVPFGVELILRAQVKDGSGLPAKTGTVIFEYCSLNRPNDDTQVDEVPMEACANGTATWTSLERPDEAGRLVVTTGVNASGEALMNFGYVSITPVIGFRFRYLDSGSGIGPPSGTSAAANCMFHP
jgi:hypothetical protein